MRQDGVIKDAIMAALIKADVSDVQVDVRAGIAIVQGVVDILNDRKTVESIIKKVPGVVDVQNKLTVATEKAVENKAIEQTIEEKFQRHRELERITASITKGIVVLQGEVENLNIKRYATKLAGEVQGVREIVNRLKIKSPERDDDVSITNAVEAALAADGRVNSWAVKTSTKEGRVTLEGDVDTSTQAVRAEQLAASVPGVKNIINRISLVGGRGASKERKLTIKIQKNLENHPRIGKEQILVHVMGKTVYLAGEVFTPDAKNAAESIAKNIEGIKEVNSNIEIVTH